MALDGQQAAAARVGVNHGLGDGQLSVALEEIELSQQRSLGQFAYGGPDCEQSAPVDLCIAA